jgi:hypothetical protein
VQRQQSDIIVRERGGEKKGEAKRMTSIAKLLQSHSKSIDKQRLRNDRENKCKKNKIRSSAPLPPVVFQETRRQEQTDIES